MEKMSTGLAGLDEILFGGLIPQKAYLLQGGPGSGKSTFGFHFLHQAIQDGKKALYITLGESRESIIQNASQTGIDLSEVTFLDLSPKQDLSKSQSYNVFSSTEVEQQPIMETIVETVKEKKPDRVLLDSITMLRLLNRDPYQMRKMALSFIDFVCRNATLVMTSEFLENSSEKDASFWVDGIIKLKNRSPWRQISITKYRGSNFISGEHTFKITDGGILVFPRLQPYDYERKFKNETLSSGIEEIDKLMHGGIEKGTTNLFVGPTGVGKTNLGLQFIKAAATRNERSAVYSFEESKELIIRRSEMINNPLKAIVKSGNLKIMPVEPLSYSPDEFSEIVRRDVEENDTRMVMIDSVGGYKLAVRDEDTLERLHSLTVYLQNMGVTTLLLNESQNVTGTFSATNMNASYLADTILFLRYLEINGHLKKAIGILKKRLSSFEKSIREFEITSEGIKVGGPLENMRGILTGLPEVYN